MIMIKLFLCRLLCFGAGRRQCPGEVLAKNRLFLVVTSLLQKFKFLPGKDRDKPKHDPRDFQPGFQISIKPYQVQAVPR